MSEGGRCLGVAGFHAVPRFGWEEHEPKTVPEIVRALKVLRDERAEIEARIDELVERWLEMMPK